jgi:trk system potassium uptake protein TrkA
MRVVIVGGGKIGSYLAGELSRAGHFVAVIEEKPSRARSVVEAVKVLVFEGDGTDPDLLEAADVDRADWLIALTGQDEDNLVATQLGKTLGAKRVMARLNDPANRATFKALEIPVVSVTDLIAQVISKEVKIPDLAMSDLFGGGKVAVQELEIPESFEPCLVSDLSIPRDALLVTVMRGDNVFVVRGTTTVKPGDHVLVASTISAAADVCIALGVYGPTS